MKILFLIALVASSSFAVAQTSSSALPAAPVASTTNTTNTTETTISTQGWRKYTEKLGMTYMSFFDGPSILTDNQSITPNALGNPQDDGLLLNNNVSLKYKYKGERAIDFQMRFHYVFNNASEAEDFQAFRWQSPRIGISDTFWKSENAKFSGAFNTDLPYFLPEPIGGGYIAERRTTLLTPGFFAKYTYAPTTSRWSIFSLVQPRYYIYRDRHVAESQLGRAGYPIPELKNELTISFSPSVNYAFNDKFGSRIGTEIIYKKLVVSDWNPFNSTGRSADPKSKAWRMQPMPIQWGFTYSFSKMLEVSAYIQAYPIASQRMDRTGKIARFEETVSAGTWINGTLF
jgi:hypothetical protein